MHKKRFIAFLLITIISTSLLWITPDHANAGWFGEKSFAATFTSFFSRVKSFVTNALTPQATAPVAVQAACIPPVPSRPARTDSGSKYGSLAVTPEISTAGPNNIITISVTTNLEAPEHISFVMPIGTSKDDLIDWYPKDPSVVRFDQYNTDGEKGSGSYGWGVVNDKTKLPTNQTYWVKIRARYSTIPERAKDATESHGWRKIQYSIGNRSTSSHGTQGIYVGREQKPSLIITIQNYDPKYQTLYGKFLKPFTVVPNGYFEIQTKSLGQPGMVTLAVKNAKILGSDKQHVKADETIAWKIQPLSMDPVRLLDLSLANTCGQDHFVDPAKSVTLADFDKFTFPVVYDFEKLIQDQVELSLGARGEHQSLTTGQGELFTALANLSTKGETRIPVPGVPITFRAIYANGAKETVKNIIFRSSEGEKENVGEITIATIRERNNSAFGSALVRMSGLKLTTEDAKRGIILTAEAKKFPGLSAQMTIPVVIPKIVLPQPKSPTPTPKPAPSEQSKKIFPQNLVISPDRSLDGLREEDQVTFTAKLVMSDGSTQIVKTGVKWTLIGQVGSITPGGVFSAKLDEAIAEYGEGSGIVTATYVDAGGTKFIGTTPTFRVEAFIPDDANMGG